MMYDLLRMCASAPLTCVVFLQIEELPLHQLASLIIGDLNAHIYNYLYLVSDRFVICVCCGFGFATCVCDVINTKLEGGMCKFELFGNLVVS